MIQSYSHRTLNVLPVCHIQDAQERMGHTEMQIAWVKLEVKVYVRKLSTPK